jgi:hypothetical protein
MTKHQVTAPGQERMRSIKQAWSAEHAARMEKQGFTKDGKVVPDPHPEQVTVWHQRADSRLTPMTPTSKGVWAAPYWMLNRHVFMIPVTSVDTTGTSPGRYPCADCGQQARFVVIENALEPDVHGWQWCGVCQVGG